MNDTLESAGSAGARSPEFRQVIRDAMRYWEPRRIIYNVVLALVFAAWVFLSWPHFRASLDWQALLFVIIFGAFVNLCYCAAYPADIIAQYSPLHAAWKRRRWVLWLAGTALAFLFTNYWIADEIYPFAR